MQKLGGKNLESIQKAFEKARKITIEKIGNVDFNNSISIIAMDAPDRAIPEDGASGYTANQSVIFLYLNSKHANETSIYSTICHELTHAKRFMALPDFDNRLISGLISEGIAIAFENEVHDKTKSETFFLKTMNERIAGKKLLTKIKDDLLRTDYDWSKNYAELFFTGSESKNLPR